MIRSVIILSCLLLTSHSRPAQTCDRQEPCLDIKMKSLDDGEAYRVCITLDASRHGCNKQGQISFGCPNGNEYDKIKGWKEGDDNKMCKTVKCGSEAQFGIKDGKGCRKTKPMLGLTNNGITDIRCEFTGGYCHGGNQQDCTWTIPTPQCPIASCPSDQPSPGDACNFEETCYWGEESCCGQTFDSFGCQCADGQATCFNTDACLGAPQICGTTEGPVEPVCPSDQPSPGDPCNFAGTCYWGEESCCGKTFDSFGCQCADGQAVCFYTDACLVPPCEPEPAFCGGIAAIPCEDGFYCVDDPNDICDGDGADCGGICVQPGDECNFCLRPLCACGLCPDGENMFGCCGTCEYQKGETELECLYTGNAVCPVTESAGSGAEINFKRINDNHDINNNKNSKWYNGLSDWQFLVLTVSVSIITCLLIIAVCLTCYYLFMKCNVPKYQSVNNQKVDIEI